MACPEGIMEASMRALEVTGMVDEQGQLHLDEPLRVTGPGRVRVILLFPDAEDINESEWLSAASRNPAFDFLKEPEEDIYTLADGRPFHDER